MFTDEVRGGRMSRRHYTAEFKSEAVRLVRERGVSLRQGARELGITVNTLAGWVKRDRVAGSAVGPATAPEVARLQREVARLKMERDILKRAAAYFAQESK
jgi:transposase